MALCVWRKVFFFFLILTIWLTFWLEFQPENSYALQALNDLPLNTTPPLPSPLYLAGGRTPGFKLIPTSGEYCAVHVRGSAVLHVQILYVKGAARSRPLGNWSAFHAPCKIRCENHDRWAMRNLKMQSLARPRVRSLCADSKQCV